MKNVFALFCLALVGVATATDQVDLATFDGAKGTTFKWEALNDPVMGGQSHSTFSIANNLASWTGEVKIVPSLKAPGFCNAKTTDGFGVFDHFNDASPYTHLELRMRATVEYSGYKVSFSADTLNPQFASFKSPFELAGDGQWHTVSIPFDSFSNDWSAFTGDCFTKDPDGKQHKCCSKANPEVCPTKKNLKDISEVGLWMEGKAGNFSVEVDWIRAGFADTCAKDEYCCPDAQACLKPSNISCATDASACDGTDSPVCCPLTKLCVKPSQPCTTPCADSGSFCCPEAKHCLTPTNPGVLCSASSPCAAGETCCPVTSICVTVGDVCNPFDQPNAPWWPATTLGSGEAGFIGKDICAGPVQSDLRFNMSNRFSVPELVYPMAKGEALVTAICCDSAFQPFAEPPGYFKKPDVNFFGVLAGKTTTFFDPVCGIPLFTAPRNRTFAEFEADTEEHGWPSFRAAEVVSGNVIVHQSTGEVVSKCGTHLGSFLPDDKGPRYCMDLSCVSGNPAKEFESLY